MPEFFLLLLSKTDQEEREEKEKAQKEPNAKVVKNSMNRAPPIPTTLTYPDRFNIELLLDPFVDLFLKSYNIDS